jgi:Zn-dependent protease with chaperone function
MSLAYQVGLFVVALMMVLLPAVYLGFCVAVGYGIYLFATNDYFLLGYHQPGIAAYLGVIVAGCIGLVFMVKPLFTRTEKIDARVPVTQAEQPELLQFIDEVCARIGAPKPVRVLVDNQVNASASFERGILGLLTNRLDLTIGLPLAQGLTVSQFGGVLAHEFGHFTQAGAMRLNYVIRSTNGWFNRVIYERDGWDANLKAWTKRGNMYWVIMANIATGFIWLARKILWALMMAGHAVSAYMMRQMEYDADYSERQVTGSANFKNTFFRMRLINLGSQMAIGHLNESWREGKLVDNVPLLIDHMTSSISADKVQAFSAEFEADQSVAKWYSTHPSDHQRIQKAQGSGNGPALLGEQPAGVLFSDLNGLAERITRIDYAKRHRLEVKPDSLVSTTTFIDQASSRAQRLREMSAFFHGMLADHRRIFSLSTDVAGREEIAARLAEIERYLAHESVSIAEIVRKIEVARDRRAKVMAADVFVEIGIKIKASNFGLPDLNSNTIRTAIEDSTGEIDRFNADLMPYLNFAREKLFLSCRLAAIDAGSAADSQARKERLEHLEGFLRSIEPIDTLLQKYRKSLFIAAIYVNNYQAAKFKKQMEGRFDALTASFKEATNQVEHLAQQILYPLRDGKPFANVAGYLVAGNDKPGAMGRYQYLGSVFERYAFLYTEVMLEVLSLISADARKETIPFDGVAA